MHEYVLFGSTALALYLVWAAFAPQLAAAFAATAPPLAPSAPVATPAPPRSAREPSSPKVYATATLPTYAPSPAAASTAPTFGTATIVVVFVGVFLAVVVPGFGNKCSVAFCAAFVAFLTHAWRMPEEAYAESRTAMTDRVAERATLEAASTTATTPTAPQAAGRFAEPTIRAPRPEDVVAPTPDPYADAPPRASVAPPIAPTTGVLDALAGLDARIPGRPVALGGMRVRFAGDALVAIAPIAATGDVGRWSSATPGREIAFARLGSRPTAVHLHRRGGAIAGVRVEFRGESAGGWTETALSPWAGGEPGDAEVERRPIPAFVAQLLVGPVAAGASGGPIWLTFV